MNAAAPAMRTAVKAGIAASVLAELCTAPLALYAGAWSRLSGLLLGLSIMAAPLLLPLAGTAIVAAWARGCCSSRPRSGCCCSACARDPEKKRPAAIRGGP